MSSLKRSASLTIDDVPTSKKLKDVEVANAVANPTTSPLDAHIRPSETSDTTSRDHSPDPLNTSMISLANRRNKTTESKVTSLFDQNPAPTPIAPELSGYWGTKPCSGMVVRNTYADQPPARYSNAQTVPPLWEDRKYRCQKGSRYVKSFRKGLPIADDDPDLDQEDNLILKLIDMRPKNSKDPTPRLSPMYYVYQKGKPKDWGNKQAIKAINDRRQQAIERYTLDRNWTKAERNFLASIFCDFPEVSIKEATDRFNSYFKDQDFVSSTAFAWDNFSTGRTIESVRYEYLSNQRSYDAGEAPRRKELTDKTKEGKMRAKILEEKFGNSDRHLINDGNEDEYGGENEPELTDVRQEQSANCEYVDASGSQLELDEELL